MIKNLYTSKSVLLFLAAQDFNEQEYLIVSNIISRAGFKIFIVSDSNSICTGDKKLKVKNDVQLFNSNHYNFGGLVLIGGKGAASYFENKLLHSLVMKFAANKKPVAAICIAPIILAKAGILDKFATCYPDNRSELEREGIEFRDVPVSVNGKIITGQGPASASEFANTFLHELSKN